MRLRERPGCLLFAIASLSACGRTAPFTLAERTGAPTDSGTSSDAGFDAGREDAGRDAGLDAGAICDAGLGVGVRTVALQPISLYGGTGAGIAVDSQGNVYVAENVAPGSTSPQVRKVTPLGVVS